VPLLPFDARDDSSRAGVKRVALEAHRGEPLAGVDLRGGVTFVLGAERDGLPREVARDADARIPIDGAESLNVAAAGAIALYEWRRQNAAG
jgi:tRNA G18 (ribose-2'-O)-methylase SpoU